LLKVPYILGVLPTSIGKSLSYLLTSSLSISKVTIIILPLVGLKLDILRRASEFNIPCSNFEETREFKNITLISIETIIKDSFISLVQALINNNSLDRIVFNKCYLLISSSSYRSIMFRFKDLLLLPVQFVFLTGTLPLSFEDEIRSSLSLDDLTIIRASCSKSNISYKVSAYKSNIEKDKIQQISNYIFDFQRKKFLTKNNKILVFCPSKANTILVANSLNCSRFYSSLSNKNKSNTLKRFLTSKDPYYSILACTSVL
jgi:superfamily II DNA helicase RecQ